MDKQHFTVTQELVRKLFTYHNGKLFYRHTQGPMKKGKEAGGIDKDGYVRIAIKRKQYKAHRLIYLYHHGRIPENIDHEDGNPLNNRISNLRECTLSQNNLNRGKHKRNTSGYKGVTWVERLGKFSSRIQINDKRLFLGYFDDAKSAHLAYINAADKHDKEFIRT